MPPTFPKMVLWITAVIYLGFAVWLGVFPNALLQAFGIPESTPAMLTEIRAFYGGIEIGIALVMMLLSQQGHIQAALLVGGVPLGCSAIGRALGMALDGFSNAHTGFALVEAIGCITCIYASYLAQRSERISV